MCDKNHISSTVIFSAVRTLLICLTVLAVNAAAADPINFDELVVDAGFHIEQPVLTASLVGDEHDTSYWVVVTMNSHSAWRFSHCRKLPNRC